MRQVIMEKEIRKDITGLRALAVLSVLLFHFNPAFLSGGFAGVDVFFVISGFLMTSIIFRGIENNHFNLIQFLKARTARIVPALVTIIIITLMAGFIFIEPSSYKLLGKHAVGSLLFISNLFYWGESGYFDTIASSKFLLHTWSLSVEWQFYIIYPLGLIGLRKKFNANITKAFLVTATVILFIVCVYLSEYTPTFSYFMLPTRAWEMLLGGLVYLYPIKINDRYKKYVEIIGILLIIYAFFKVNGDDLWPGYMSLLPAFGTCLCLWANNKKSVLSFFVFQKIGLWSYSIYLIHWPVIVLFKKLTLNLPFYSYLMGVLISAFVLYTLIEKKRNCSIKLLAVYLLTLFISFLISLNGVSWRSADPRYSLSQEAFHQQFAGNSGVPNSDKALYLSSDINDFEYILIGDSHARHFYSYILQNKIKVASFAADACISTKNYYSKNNPNNCINRYKTIVDFIKKHPNKKIIWSAAWNITNNRVLREKGTPGNIIDELSYFIDEIKETNSQLYLIGDTQESQQVIYECLAKQNLLTNKFLSFDCNNNEKRWLRKIDKSLETLAQHYPNVFFINASNALCDDQRCKVIDNNMPIYTDTSHLSKHGSDIVGSYIFGKIAAFK